MQIYTRILILHIIMITIHSTFGFLIPVSFWNQNKVFSVNRSRSTTSSSNCNISSTTTTTTTALSSTNDNDFTMPSPETLISDIPKDKRGIGVGIDLGTTNSAIGMLNEEGIPYLIQIDGKSTIPSVVTLQSNTKEGHSYQIFIGEKEDDPLLLGEGDDCDSFTYRHVKRVIGMGTEVAASNAEVVPHLLLRTASQRRKGKSIHKANLKEGLNGVGLQKMLNDAKEHPVRFALPPGVIVPEEEDDDDDDGVRTTTTAVDENKDDVHHATVSPEFLSSQILKKLFQTAEQETGERITRAVIGVPAYFNDLQREATIKAACMASGIPSERIRLLREPEAAALAYGIGKQQIGKGDEEELVLVFDLGGGTFDVSILEVGGGIYEVVATGGNNMLGGSDFDARIAQHFAKKMMEHGCSKNYWNEGNDVAEKMVTSAEQVRIALSNNREVTLALPLTDHGWLSMANPRDVIVRDNEKSISEASDSSHVVFQFSRKAMETLCLDIFLALLRPVREVAILGGAMLPGDTNPSAVEAVLQMEEELDMELARNAGKFENFFDEESGEAKPDPDDDISEATLLQLKNYDLKDRKKMQQRGRKRARNLQKDEKKFRQEKRKASENAKTASQNIKVRDGINGRRLTQIILVGGATRMPAIGRLLAAVTGVVPQKTVNPDECVALGCAVQVGILDGINTELQVLSPIEAAMMRALAKKRGVTVDFDEDDDDFGEGYVEEYF